MESVKDEMLDIVGWYKNLPDDYIDINQLMYGRKQLATYSVTLGTEASRARGKWKLYAMQLEVIKNQKRLQNEVKGMGLTKADWTARGNVVKELELATKWEVHFYDLEYVLRTVREVLGEMNQRISYLRAEQQQEEKFNN
jgi:hypothetical protein